uniref:Uncharacterized protein n=1 Tax=Ficus carica TaxID=3494 RepID=A0AA88CUD0_FICCA|nr:hypothetical protein TIFTF001_048517 [Ficus carica]GMN18723.1 hypothetical protein TIFTF001_048521 [Ficus carica]
MEEDPTPLCSDLTRRGRHDGWEGGRWFSRRGTAAAAKLAVGAQIGPSEFAVGAHIAPSDLSQLRSQLALDPIAAS